jgi:hypothetical protein
VWLLKSDEKCDDEELKTPEVRVVKAAVLLEGEDVSVSVDADSEEDVVVDGAPSLGPGSKPERDTLGSTLPRAERPAETTAETSSVFGAAAGAGSEERMVETLVTVPDASM